MCLYTSNSNNLKIWKPPFPKKNPGVCVVVDYADTGFLSLRSNIFAKTKKFAKSILPVHMGPSSILLSQKNGQKSRDTVPLKGSTTRFSTIEVSLIVPGFTASVYGSSFNYLLFIRFLAPLSIYFRTQGHR